MSLYLCLRITGFDGISLQPNAGAQGEFAGLLAIKKFHESNNQGHRKICLIPNSAHGTNPASAQMAGMKVIVIDSAEDGNIDLLDLDHLSNIADINLDKRKQFIPDAEIIISEIKKDFEDWVETRKYAPTVNALKAKLKQIQDKKINVLKKKSNNFNEENVMEVGEHLIQKITNQIASHLKESKEFEEELESIRTIFQLDSNE